MPDADREISDVSLICESCLNYLQIFLPGLQLSMCWTPHSLAQSVQSPSQASSPTSSASYISSFKIKFLSPDQGLWRFSKIYVIL